MHTSPVPLKLIASATSIAALAFLSACGGGGGGGATTTSSGPSTISLSGVAAKGLIGNANVRVLGVKSSDGSVDETQVLAQGQISAGGVYTTTAFTVPAVYVVEVSAKTCADVTVGTGCSFHQDEVTNTVQYLPTGFKLRAVVTGAPANNKVNVTPFSELAVSAATRASGGLTVANASQAVSKVNQLIGVADLNAVVPTTLDDTQATSDQIRLAAMLTAVSGMASTAGDLGACGTGTAPAPGSPAATKCVVDKLAANANLSGSFVGSDAAVSTALSTALTAAVASNPAAQALVTSTQAKLTDPDILPVDAALASGIDKVKAFFNDLTSTVRTMVDSGSTPGQGALLAQAHLFENAVTGLDLQANATADGVQALYLATRLWTDYEHGGTAVDVDLYKELTSPSVRTGIHCSLRKQGTGDAVYVQPGDAPSLVTSVDCYADATFDIDWSQGHGTFTAYTYPFKNGYQHFVVTKGGSGFQYVAKAFLDESTVAFNYQTGTSEVTFDPTPTCPQSSGDVCRAFMGTITTSLDSAGRLASIRVAGDLPDGWVSGSVPVHASAGAGNLARTAIDVSVALSGTTYAGTALDAVLQSATFSFSGGNVAYAANGTTVESRITFAQGSQMAVANEAFQSGNFNLTLLTPTSKLTGVLTAQSTANHGGTGNFTGALYNLAQSETVPFVSASLTATLTRPAGFDPTRPISTTNAENIAVNFDGFVTAPNHPKLRLVLGAAAYQSSPKLVWGTSTQDTASGNFIVYNADGSTRRDVSFTVTSPNHDGRTVTALTDVAHGISLSLADGQSTADVLVAASKVGVLNTRNSRLSFSNGEFMSLDFGTVLYSD